MAGSMIQIRNVPPEVHCQLKSRAALAGMSLSEYLLRELQRTLERPTRQEVLERIGRRAPVVTGISSADLIHEIREERDRELESRMMESMSRSRQESDER